MEKRGIGVSNLPNQRYRSTFNKEISYNLLLIGEKGLGKSTFINKLLNKTIIDTSTNTSLTNCNKYTIKINEQGYKLKLNIIEYTCHSNLVNNENCHLQITKYLKDSFNTSNNIHLILYFYDTISNLNLFLMDQLNKYSNLICVLAKSDINLRRELMYENYLFNVNRKCNFGEVNEEFLEVKERVIKQMVDLIEKSKIFRKRYMTHEIMKEMGLEVN